MPDHTLVVSIPERLEADQLKRAYTFYPLATSSSYLLLLLNAFVMWGHVNSIHLLLWFLAGTLINLYRYAIYRRFPAALQRGPIKPLQRIHEILTTLSAALWGYGVWFLLPVNSLPHVLFYMITVAGLCAGASSTLATTPRAYLYFLVLCLVPEAVRFYIAHDDYGLWLGGLTVVFGFYMWAACSRNAQTSEQNLLQSYSLEEQEKSLAESRKRLDLHYERSPLAVIEWDPQLHVRRWNPAAETIFGRTENDALGCVPADFMTSENSYFDQLRESRQSLSTTLNTVNHVGETISCEWVSTPLLDDESNLLGFTSFVTDVTDKVARDELIRKQAYYDAVTGLPNRYYFHDRLADEVSRVRRTKVYSCVLFMDLDEFKQINDSLGHAVGDELLLQLAERLKKRLRGYETVARFGGDEFVILLESLAPEREKAELIVSQIAQSLQDLLRQPFTLENSQYTLSCSIGISLFNSDKFSEDELLKQADLALYQSKHAGRNRYTFFKDEMGQIASRHLALLNNLRDATLRDEMHLVYQPKVHLDTLRLQGAEVLLRWQSPELGSVSPGEFIPILESSALISKVGWWVLDQAFAQLNQWLAVGYWRDGMRLAINISPNQLLERGFVELVAELLQSHQLDGNRVEFEITENVLVRDTGQVYSVLIGLNELGISFSIDDFGTGYSSLAYLKALPIDVLKIDKSFIDHCTDEGNDRAIIRSVLSICNELNLTSVAEGVESKEQRDQLLAMGCDLLQGYYYSRPVSAEGFESILSKEV